VAAVDVGVGQQDDLVVADLGDVEVLRQSGTHAAMSAWISAFFSILSMRARSTFKILPRIGRIAWRRGRGRPWPSRPPSCPRR